MTSVTGLLEERETLARVQVEEFRVEADRVLAKLSEAETVLERQVIARVELAEALAAPAAVDDPLTSGPQNTLLVPVVNAPVAGSVVPRRHDGMGMEALAPDYRRIIEVPQADPAAGEAGLSVKELTGWGPAGR